MKIQGDESQDLAAGTDGSPRPAQARSKATTLGLHFGALVHSIAKQLSDQGVRMDIETQAKATMWQKDADAITRLAVRQLLPEAAARGARKKLLKKIIREIENGKK